MNITKFIKYFKVGIKKLINPFYLNDYLNELFLIYPWSSYCLRRDYSLNIIILYKYKPPLDSYPKTIYMPFIYKGIPIVYKESYIIKL